MKIARLILLLLVVVVTSGCHGLSHMSSDIEVTVLSIKGDTITSEVGSVGVTESTVGRLAHSLDGGVNAGSGYIIILKKASKP